MELHIETAVPLATAGSLFVVEPGDHFMISQDAGPGVGLGDSLAGVTVNAEITDGLRPGLVLCKKNGDIIRVEDGMTLASDRIEEIIPRSQLQ